jgi:hypothetical protein
VLFGALYEQVQSIFIIRAHVDHNNRALKVLRDLGPLSRDSKSYAQMTAEAKNGLKDIFGNLEDSSEKLTKVKEAVLEGFRPAKKKANVMVQVAEPHGNVKDRKALLAHAIVDPDLLNYFLTITAPIEADARPGFLDAGGSAQTRARWTILSEKIMARCSLYSNIFADLHIPGFGCVVESVRPEHGIFCSTECTPVGVQLKMLFVEMMNQYNILLSKLDKSGFNKKDDARAYERTGVEGRPKDIALFYFYLVVRDHDVAFMSSVLEPFECNGDSDCEDNGCSGDDGEGPKTKYGKRKAKKEQQDADRRKKEREDTIQAIGAAVGVDGTESEAKITAYIAEKESRTELHAKKAAHEEVATLLSVINSHVFDMPSDEEQVELKNRVKDIALGRTVA